MTEVAAASRASMGHMMLQKQRGWEMLIYCVIGFSEETNESQERHGEEPAVDVFLQKNNHYLIRLIRSCLQHRFSQHKHRSQSREVPQTGRGSIARQTRQLMPSSNLESPFHLTNRFFSWKVHTGQEHLSSYHVGNIAVYVTVCSHHHNNF